MRARGHLRCSQPRRDWCHALTPHAETGERTLELESSARKQTQPATRLSPSLLACHTKGPRGQGRQEAARSRSNTCPQSLCHAPRHQTSRVQIRGGACAQLCSPIYQTKSAQSGPPPLLLLQPHPPPPPPHPHHKRENKGQRTPRIHNGKTCGTLLLVVHSLHSHPNSEIECSRRQSREGISEGDSPQRHQKDQEPPSASNQAQSTATTPRSRA